MSWSESLSNVSLDEIEGTPPNAYTSTVPEHLDQFAKAKTVAQDIILSGVLGDPATKRFNVNIGGHGNPNHEPAQGWVNDCISISISQLSPPKEEV
jgi:hypothetical protein